MSPDVAAGETSIEDRRVAARDGFSLSASIYSVPSPKGVVLVNSATAVPRQFYRHFAACLQAEDWAVVTYDYRGIGGSRPARLAGFDARMRDWAFLDMTAMLDFVAAEFQPRKIVVVGHSFGGQAAGMLENAELVDAMVGVSAQSGYWAVQGGFEPLRVGFAVMVLMPLLSGLMGYFPWKRLVGGEDLPKGVAREWARWARNPRYLLGDDSLPLERFAAFDAPVLAYSIDDDNWGTAAAVNSMMQAYPRVERRHIVPRDYDIDRLGHMGFFRPGSEALWRDVIEWLEKTA